MPLANEALVLRRGPSGPAIQPWYGLTEIDDKLADTLHYRRQETAQGRVYALQFTYRSKTVATLGELTVRSVQHATGHANAWLIATSRSEAGILKDSTLAGAYGLSPKEVRRRSRFAASKERGREAWAAATTQADVEATESHRMAIMRGIVEDAAHQLLADNVASPTARMQVLIAICSRLDAHAQAGRLAVRSPDTLWRHPAAGSGR